MIPANTSDELVKILNKNFDLSACTSLDKSDLPIIKQYLTAAIQQLLNKDMERLLSIFYKIDLDENKVNQILTFSNTDSIAEKLSELVIERELQKVLSRIKYRDQE